ncbi:sensor histidine kinase [Acetobacter aceti]|nr:HAMP domain-containing sensor histidine kinase [Acetobacter aceti]
MVKSMKVTGLSAVRLACIFTLLFLLLGTSVTFWLGSAMRSLFMHNIDQDLTSEVSEAFGARQEPHDVLHLEPNVRTFIVTDQDYRYLLQDRRGHVVAGNLPTLPPVSGFRWIDDTTPGLEKGQRYYGLGEKLDDGGYYFVAHDTSPIDTLNESVLETILLGFAAFVFCGVGGGLLMGILVRRRLLLIGQAVQTIQKGDLTARLPVAAGQDELDDLCSMFNAVLDQNERLVESLRQVSNDIAHDMRTPLTRLRHRLQQLVSGPQMEVKSEANLAIEDLDASLEMFSSLLQLAEIEAAGNVTRQEAVDLSEEVNKCLEIFGSAPEDSEHHIDAELVRHIMIHVDVVLLRQLVSNILDNALLHTPAGTSITVSVRKTAGQALLCVADNGPGVPAALLHKLPERFFRLDRSRTTPGTGLGISLARAIAERFGGSLLLEDNAPGLRVLVSFPLSDGRITGRS